MGMESYYIKLNIKGLKNSYDIKQLFKQKYKVSKYKMSSGKLFKRKILDDNRFVIDNKAIVTITTMQNTADITFELCFSNYENNLLYIYNVAEWISSIGETVQLNVLNAEYDFKCLNYEEFKTIVSESFFNKHRQFKIRYGEINKDILPQDFYNRFR